MKYDMLNNSETLQGSFSRRDFLRSAAGGAAATVLAGAHGAVDFGIQIPAVAATYAAIMGAACAQAFRLEIPEHRTGERRAA